MKVYLVYYHYCNGGLYEDNYTDKSVETICATREIAEKYIASYDPNVTWEVEKNNENPWIEGNPYPKYQLPDDLRHFHRKGHYGEEEEYFTIYEMEVLE